LDNVTGTPTSFIADFNNTVYSLVVSNSTLFVGGAYISVGSDSRSRLTAFDINVILPVHLLTFTANAANKTVICNWTTTSEENSAYFIVERSKNGSDFTPIGQVAASGNSTVEQRYNFTDNAPLTGTSYYRLKLVDIDSKFTYSQIVAILSGAPSALFTVYPNPADQQASLVISLDRKQDARYDIYDQTGKRLVSGTVSLTQGVNTVSLPVKSLPAGIYALQVKTDAFTKQTRFVKQ
jgi:hypothetical protein